jgi:hypothetical protein
MELGSLNGWSKVWDQRCKDDGADRNDDHHLDQREALILKATINRMWSQSDPWFYGCLGGEGWPLDNPQPRVLVFGIV